MISLLEIAQSINEADDEKVIKYKKKDGESGEMKAGSAKSMPKDHPAKIAWDKMQDDGDGEEKPKGQAMSGSDFDRDSNRAGDDDADDMDRDARFAADDDEDDDKNASEKENEKIEKELNSIADYFGGLTVGSEDANHGGEIHSLVGKDDDPDNVLGFHAAPNYDDDGNMTDEPQYAIELGMGSSPIYFDSKEEADKSLKKMLGDKKIRKAMDGEGDGTLADLGDHAKSIADDAKKPESELEKLDKEIKSTEATMNMYQSDYSDSRNQAMANDLSQKLRKLRADREKLVAGSDKNETKVINGVKYKAIKESKKNYRILKENYDRIFRSRK